MEYQEGKQYIIRSVSPTDPFPASKEKVIGTIWTFKYVNPYHDKVLYFDLNEDVPNLKKGAEYAFSTNEDIFKAELVEASKRIEVKSKDDLKVGGKYRVISVNKGSWAAQESADYIFESIIQIIESEEDDDVVYFNMVEGPKLLKDRNMFWKELIVEEVEDSTLDFDSTFKSPYENIVGKIG